MSDDSTEPNLKANTPRNLLLRGWATAQAHPDKAIALILIVAAFILGRCSA